ncbi:MAG: ankyrin repeat domain-containing protein [Bdellovibrionales bacterium]|nr:ankyrin repeat domain-containing protein [Bdellovibrionales bacterium]
MIKKLFLGIGIVFIAFIGITMCLYNKEVSRVQQNPKQAHTDGIMKDGNITALHHASWNGDYGKVSQLLQQGHDIHSKTVVYKFTPFHMAIFKGHTKVADLLLSKGANIDEGSNFNQTPLQWAAFIGEVDSADFLIKEGADLEKLSDQGWTALHYASTMGNLGVVKLLIQKGAKADKKTGDGQTAKELAKSNKREEVVQFLNSL